MVWNLSAFADEAADDLSGQIQALNASKLRRIDVRNVDGVNISQLPVVHAEKVRYALDAAGIAVGMLGSPVGKSNMDDLFMHEQQRLEHLAAVAPVLGCNAIRIFSYFNQAGRPAAIWENEAVERLLRLIDMAEQYDLVLYHENEPGLFGGTREHVAILHERVQLQAPDRFKLIFDFDNYLQAGDDVHATYLEQRDWLGAIHLKESVRQPDGTFMHVPIGTGDAQVEPILRDLSERGFDGPLTLEPHLARSAAVLATGPHGAANQALSDMTPAECFAVAAEAAHRLLEKVGRAPVPA